MRPDANVFGDGMVQKIGITGPGRYSIHHGPWGHPTPELKHLLLLQDGTQLHGELISLLQNELLWRRPDVNEPLRFSRAEVLAVFLALPKADWLPEFEIEMMNESLSRGSRMQPPVLATLKLPGGDWLYGELTSRDGRGFSLKLNGATPIAVSSEEIEWLHFGTKAAPAGSFTGSALSMSGWLPTSNAASFSNKDGRFTASVPGQVSRAISLTPQVEIDLDLPENAEAGCRLWLQAK